MTTLDTIKKILAEQLELDEGSITETSTIEDLGADSLDLVEAIMNIEDEFGVEIDDEEIKNLKTVGDIVEYINNNK